jgi:glutamate synthase (NADPH) small chain
LSTLKFIGNNNQVTHTLVQQVGWIENGQHALKMNPIPGTEEEIKSDIVLLAMGFVHPVLEGLLSELKIETNERKNVKVSTSYQTNCEKVFAAGDAKDGATLVVRAIKSGRVAAQKIHEYLKK